MMQSIFGFNLHNLGLVHYKLGPIAADTYGGINPENHFWIFSRWILVIQDSAHLKFEWSQ